MRDRLVVLKWRGQCKNGLAILSGRSQFTAHAFRGKINIQGKAFKGTIYPHIKSLLKTHPVVINSIYFHLFRGKHNRIFARLLRADTLSCPSLLFRLFWHTMKVNEHRPFA